MKKLLLTMTAAALCTPVWAQWSADYNANLTVSPVEKTGASLTKVNETPDGKFWVTWLQWEEGMNGYIRTQLLDRDGVPQFEEGGVYVSKHATASWTSDFDAKCDREGNLIVAHSDSRNDTDNRQTFEPYVYMVNQEGEMLWGLDGVMLPNYSGESHRPKIGVSNEGTIFVGYNDIKGNDMDFRVMRMNPDGTFAWEQPVVYPGTMGVFAPCEEDDFYLSIISGGGICLYRLDSLGDEVWDSPLTVEARDPNTRGECVPVEDGLGGLLMSFQRYISFSQINTCLQHITPDGETTMGLQPIDLSQETGTHSRAGLAANGKRGEVAAYWDWSFASHPKLAVQKYNYYGDPLWDEPAIVDENDMWGFASAHGTMLDDGGILMVYGAYQGAVKVSLRMTRLDADGTVVWTRSLHPDAYVDDPEAIFDDTYGYLFWASNHLTGGSSPYDHIFGQRVSLSDGEPEVSSLKGIQADALQAMVAGALLVLDTPCAGTVEIYDIAGSKVAAAKVSEGRNTLSMPAAKGMYVVRMGNRSIKLIN